MDCGGESSPSIPVVQRRGRPQLALHRIKVLSVCNSGRGCHTSEQTPTWERQCWQPGFLQLSKTLLPVSCCLCSTHPFQSAAAREGHPGQLSAAVHLSLSQGSLTADTLL